MSSITSPRYRRLRWLLIALFVLLTAGASSAAAPAAPGAEARTEHVIIISVDGLRPDAIDRFAPQTIRGLIDEGSYSSEATTILPSKTLPSHTSMLTGVKPKAHGVYWNRRQMDEHGHITTPTVFAAARAAGLRTAAFFSKAKFEHLAIPGALDHAYVPGGVTGRSRAENTALHVENYLAHTQPNLLFVHFGEPDFAGHVFGWMSAPYGVAVRLADRQLRELLSAADRAFGSGNYTVILTSDHGGHGRGHGSDDPRDVTIPWVAWGEAVRPGAALLPVRTVDTAATALWLLGVPIDASVAGRAVAEAFE